ncbi:hypothetical protein IEO21_01374 [Rhodonia placenta]|uniref:GH16 domain-containing protein n=1 Tax=Rhodonia placenta TaxID=104341 RepID=A0A8H7PA04_9APHY|nr:hypothetical protein IEO21_01374 [Postia placenta]
MRTSAIFLTISSLVVGSLAGTYNIDKTYIGEDFLNTWTHEVISDPTHGRVDYVTQATALAENLTYANGDTLIMRADATTVLSASGPGRKSVRLQSQDSFGTHIVIFDVRHMPVGCGTWPAAWETGPNWPANGEVDVIEGVNDQGPNLVSLHVATTCSMPSSGRDMSGTAGSLNCDVNTDGNSGCGVNNPTSNSFGHDFNNAGGGWYAMERTSDEVKVWFWSRQDSTVPGDVQSGADEVNTNNWNQPVAYFPSTDCDIGNEFGKNNNLIFDLTFCGDWAGGSSYAAAGCSGTCVDWVNNHPSSFHDSYWDVAAVRVYT